MAQKNEQKRQLAQSLFLNTDSTIQEIARTVEVTAKTVSDWKKKYNWESLKSIQSVANPVILAKLYKRVENLVEDPYFSTKDLANLKNSIDFFSPDKIALDTIITIMKEFVDFLNANNAPIDIKALNDLQNDFIKAKINQYEV